MLERWFSDISGLYSGLHEKPETAYSDIFYNRVLEKNRELENIMSQEKCAADQPLDLGDINTDNRYNEVSEVIDQSKFKKSYLDIPNEVLKNKHAKVLLFHFFKLCFTSGYNPTDWDYSDIIPIPKKGKDARDHLQNRCITIVCCIAKIYTSILNKRIQGFLERNSILAEEQSGFRAGIVLESYP